MRILDPYRHRGRQRPDRPAAAGTPVAHLRRLPQLTEVPGAITVNGVPVTVRFVPRPGDLLAADVSDLPGENPTSSRWTIRWTFCTKTRICC